MGAVGRNSRRPDGRRSNRVTGAFEVNLQWTPDSPAGAATDGDLPSIFTAMHEQLGLELEPARGPVDVLVIVRAEKPTEN